MLGISDKINTKKNPSDFRTKLYSNFRTFFHTKLVRKFGWQFHPTNYRIFIAWKKVRKLTLNICPKKFRTFFHINFCRISALFYVRFNIFFFKQKIDTKKNPIFFSWCIWASGHLDIWASGHLGIWASGRLGIWASRHLGIWASGHLGIWASEHLGFLASG